MKTVKNSPYRFILSALLLCGAMPVLAQNKPATLKSESAGFYHLAAQAGLKFTYPGGFMEIPALNNEDFSFDFAIDLPGKGFEAWFRVRPQKQNWESYEHTKYDEKMAQANPDSMYVDMARANALALSGDDSFLMRKIPPDVLARYNADAGESILINLLDLPATKHYKYALIIALQKFHTGTLVAIYFTNNKDPEFYKNVYRAGRSFKFKPQTTN